MKVSVCCITYNHGRYIREALTSFLNQHIEGDWEIVISDDFSEDETCQIIKDFQNEFPGRIILIQNSFNKGMILNMVQALENCKGEYIAFCEGDDFWIDKYKVQKQIEVLEANKECSFSFHDVTIVDERGKHLNLLSKGREIDNRKDGILSSEYVIGAPLRIVHLASLLFRKNDLPKSDYWNLFLDAPMGDYQLVVFLSALGDAYYLNKSMAVYRINSASISQNRSIADTDFLKKVKAVYQKVDVYFQRKYHNELVRGYKGHVIMNIEANMDNAVLSRSLNKYLYYSAKLLIRFKGSQYNLKDVLWLIKEGGRKFFSKKKASDK